MSTPDEPQAITERYAHHIPGDGRSSFLRVEVCLGVQERLGVMLQLFRQHSVTDFADLRLLEVECDTGGNLLEFLRMGCAPDRAHGGNRTSPGTLCSGAPCIAASGAPV